jgi:rhodanese-related sulfurtransferase
MTYVVIAALLVALIWIGLRVLPSRSSSVLNTTASNTAVTNTTTRLTPGEYQTQFVQPKTPHLLVDVRTAGEFAGGHIPGAVNIDLQQLSSRLNEIPRDQPVVLYCRSGSRSATAARLLGQQGYEHVYDLGGIIAWQRQGLPVR